MRATAVLLCIEQNRADRLVEDTLKDAVLDPSLTDDGPLVRLLELLIEHFHDNADYQPSKEELKAGRMDTIPEHRAPFLRAFFRLPGPQREALLLVTGPQLSYGEAAKILKCAQGTIKSRVSRAREALAPVVRAA